MGTVDFFQRLAGPMTDNPPAAADAPMLLKRKSLGVQPASRRSGARSTTGPSAWAAGWPTGPSPAG